MKNTKHISELPIQKPSINENDRFVFERIVLFEKWSVPTITLKLSSVTVQCCTRRLNLNFNPGVLEDLKNYHCIDGEAGLISMAKDSFEEQFPNSFS